MTYTEFFGAPRKTGQSFVRASMEVFNQLIEQKEQSKMRPRKFKKQIAIMFSHENWEALLVPMQELGYKVSPGASVKKGERFWITTDPSEATYSVRTQHQMSLIAYEWSETVEEFLAIAAISRGLRAYPGEYIIVEGMSIQKVVGMHWYDGVELGNKLAINNNIFHEDYVKATIPQIEKHLARKAAQKKKESEEQKFGGTVGVENIHFTGMTRGGEKQDEHVKPPVVNYPKSDADELGVKYEGTNYDPAFGKSFSGEKQKPDELLVAHMDFVKNFLIENGANAKSLSNDTSKAIHAFLADLNELVFFIIKQNQFSKALAADEIKESFHYDEGVFSMCQRTWPFEMFKVKGIPAEKAQEIKDFIQGQSDSTPKKKDPLLEAFRAATEAFKKPIKLSDREMGAFCDLVNALDAFSKVNFDEPVSPKRKVTKQQLINHWLKGTSYKESDLDIQWENTSTNSKNEH